MFEGVWRAFTRRAAGAYRGQRRTRVTHAPENGVSAKQKKSKASHVWTFEANLPDGYPARRIAFEVSVPQLPSKLGFTFASHLTGEDGNPTDTVVANGFGSFAISRDLGETWKIVPVQGYSHKDMAQVKALGPAEFIAQMGDADEAKSEALDVIRFDEAGNVSAATPAMGCRWHGCHAVARAHGTIMYAEYPHNEQVQKKRLTTARVFRSRDDGKTWQVVFHQTGDQIRHFHFLQPRPGVPGEWWLTAGDDPHECRVWVSKDDGDTWADLTDHVTGFIDVDGITYQRRVFRLTDLAWDGDEVIWGTDDILKAASDGLGGARLFRSKIGGKLKPHLIGIGKWHFRNLVDVGDFYVALSQGCPHPGANPANEKPSVYLLPKKPVSSAPGAIHLFDIPTRSDKRTKLSASRASRVAKDGVFFSLRGRTDFFPTGHRLLKWKVSFS